MGNLLVFVGEKRTKMKTSAPKVNYPTLHTAVSTLLNVPSSLQNATREMYWSERFIDH